MTNASSLPLVERLWPATDAATKTIRNVVLVAFGTLLLYASAKTQVPFWPVPITLQTMAVVLIGATYGSRLGFLTILAYLAEGAAGLPVFAGTPERGIGLAYMMGPTGGYLLSYLVAAFVAGFLIERGFARSLGGVVTAVVAANVAIYAFGLSWLSVYMGVEKAVAVGLVPFILADVLKMALASAIVLALRPRGAR